MPGKPNCLKNFSIGEPGSKRIDVLIIVSRSCSSSFADSSILTRTEITAGFTFATISANPAGDCAASAAWADLSREEGSVGHSSTAQPPQRRYEASRRCKKRLVGGQKCLYDKI